MGFSLGLFSIAFLFYDSTAIAGVVVGSVVNLRTQEFTPLVKRAEGSRQDRRATILSVSLI
jgi:hypothetical protein